MARILVIDDENNIRMMLRLALSHVGHSVETAPDGFEGLEKFDDGAAFDLVLLDQRMPGMDGLQVLHALRQIRSSIKVIMITAFGTFDLASDAFAAGAANFLRKPFTVDTLRNAVQAALTGAALGTKETPSGDPMPLSFDQASVNGYRLMSTPGVQMEKDGGISDTFRVRAANGTEKECRVVLPPFVVELVKIHADRDTMPGGEPFWQALCGEALANYLWQNAELPEGGLLRLDDLPSGLKHWMDGVFHAVGVPK